MKFKLSWLFRRCPLGAFALALTMGAAAFAAAADTGTVFFLSDTTNTPRWFNQDYPHFKTALAKYAPGLEVKFLSADSNATNQTDQVNNAITLGAKAIVLVSVDENATGGLLAAAAAAKVPVILYDHAGRGGPAAARIFYEFIMTGRMQGKVAAEDLGKREGKQYLGRIFRSPGMSVTEAFAKGQDESLKPLIDSGKIQMVCDDWAPLGASQADVQALAEQCITRNRNRITGLITLNDNLSIAMIAAIRSAGMRPGVVGVFGGQDADIVGLQNIIRGYQAATVYKPFRQSADIAAKVVASLLSTGKLPADLQYGSEDNGWGKIPTVSLIPSIMRIGDVGQLVKDGIYTWKDICVGDIAQTPTCKNQ